MTPLPISRRALLAAGSALSLNGWFGRLAASAADRPKRTKKCILLYMAGGASHVDTFDPKPGNGEFKPIATAVSGIQVSEHLPKLAMLMKDIAVIRSMTTSEGSHSRASYLAHTGYRAGTGGVSHPPLGSIVSATIGTKNPEVPNFVRVDLGRGGLDNPGYVGPAHAPLIVREPAKGIENFKPTHTLAEFDSGFALTDALDAEFQKRKQAEAIHAHRETYAAASRLIHTPKARAFDLAAEPAVGRQLYGSGAFADACLMARRLVEADVPFVEIDLGSWDTHKDNFPRTKTLSQQLDQGMSALLTDLKQRGLLADTLVVWMGDFGRTPQVKSGGRGHYPKAWTSLLCGGGLNTGRVIGRTDNQGGTVEDRPVTISDFLATVCTALSIDPAHEFDTRSGRPMRVVAKGEKIIKELF